MLDEFEMQMAAKKKGEEEQICDPGDLNGLRSMSFCPREEKNMPYDTKVWAWLEKVFVPTFVVTSAAAVTTEAGTDRPALQCKIKKAYPGTCSETASAQSENGVEQQHWRRVTRRVLETYRNEAERPQALIHNKTVPAWQNMLKSLQHSTSRSRSHMIEGNSHVQDRSPRSWHQASAQPQGNKSRY